MTINLDLAMRKYEIRKYLASFYIFDYLLL